MSRNLVPRSVFGIATGSLSTRMWGSRLRTRCVHSFSSGAAPQSSCSYATDCIAIFFTDLENALNSVFATRTRLSIVVIGMHVSVPVVSALNAG